MAWTYVLVFFSDVCTAASHPSTSTLYGDQRFLQQIYVLLTHSLRLPKREPSHRWFLLHLPCACQCRFVSYIFMKEGTKHGHQATKTTAPEPEPDSPGYIPRYLGKVKVKVHARVCCCTSPSIQEANIIINDINSNLYIDIHRYPRRSTVDDGLHLLQDDCASPGGGPCLPHPRGRRQAER